MESSTRPRTNIRINDSVFVYVRWRIFCGVTEAREAFDLLYNQLINARFSNPIRVENHVILPIL